MSSEESLGSSDEESVDGDVLRISCRRESMGCLEYLCHYADGSSDWEDRSDIWDFGRITAMIEQYDAAHPIGWDTLCQHCGVELNPHRAFKHRNGCEECTCSECDRACRHLEGINYGCKRHPVI